MKLGQDVRNAIRFFAESLMAGDLGPGDSRDVRSGFFLKEPYIVGQAMAIFLYQLEVDDDGRVLNHDEAEHRVRDYITWKEYPGETPTPPFGDDELGIMT